ncbi:hypothetical protein BC829DRAFT_394441 [Chytridium lagenaria]|nr:hypothetical protein BC829DRAFT_394441 [Chytridium lagenaria]
MVEQVTNVFSVKSRNSSAQALVAGTRVQGGREVERQVVETATSAGHITGMGSAVQVYAPPAPVVVVSDENEAAEVLFTPPSSSPQTPVLAVRHDSGFYTPPVDKEATTPSAIPSRAEPENMSNASASTRSSSSTLTNEVTTPEPQTPTHPTLPIMNPAHPPAPPPNPSISDGSSRGSVLVAGRSCRCDRGGVDLVLRCMRADTDFESGIKKVENLYAFLKRYGSVILTRTGRTQTRKIPEERKRPDDVEICVPFKVVVLAKGAKFPWIW